MKSTNRVSLLSLFTVIAFSGCFDALEEDRDTARRPNAEFEEGIATEETMYDVGEAENFQAQNPPEGQTLDAVELSEVSKEEFIREIQQRLKRVDKTLADLKDDGEKVVDEARTQWQTTWDSLKEERKILQERLAELEAASGDLWEDFRASVMGGWNNLQQSVERAKTDLQRFQEN